MTLKNRFIKTATYEGMDIERCPSRCLVRHHRELAAGGVGMTTVAYGAVSPDGRTFKDQMWLRPDAVPSLRALTSAVHDAGAKCSIQLVHCGGFSKNKELERRRPMGPSAGINVYGLMSGMAFVDAMREADIQSVVEDFGRAAEVARDAGFDAVEVHLGHGYLLSQFLSPASNRRKDAYGGDIHGRMAFPLAVCGRVLDVVGEKLAVLVKLNISDGFKGGLTIEDAAVAAQLLEAAGVHAAVLTGGFVSRAPFYLMRGGRPLREMMAVEPSWLQKIALGLFGPVIVKRYPFEELFFLTQARQIRAATRMPLVLLGGVVSSDGVAEAMADGFEFVAMGRALLHDAAFVNKLRAGEAEVARPMSSSRVSGQGGR